ncbi:SNF1-interacting protein [Microbotryomycetes sp. JL201]|nr:SNF1-interacting protein [Microbotryomycetes sp. JL201]
MGNHQSSSAHGGSAHHSQSHSPASGSRSRSHTFAGASSPRSGSSAVGLSDQTVDGGALEPQTWTYASSFAEYDRQVVHKLISDRRLAPFFLGLQDFDEGWQEDEVIAALHDAERHANQNLRDALQQAIQNVADAEANQQTTAPGTRKSKEAAQQVAQAAATRERLHGIIKHRDKRGGTGMPHLSKAEQAKHYTGKATECPICFLYYPPTMVHTRCCDQPICTECFVQIKRAEPDATHLESEPAACPYCMEPNFGSDLHRHQTRPVLQKPQGSESSSGISIEGVTTDVHPKPRRKSFAHTDREVVTTDQIHPDWEAKLEAIKAQVARRANRRIVFRQVGDRLIPVGITSGRSSDGANPTMSTATLPPGFMAQVAAAMDASNSGSSSSGRRSARRRTQELGQYLQSMGIDTGPDLEEMMVEEAMRLSLLEDEERQRKEREERDKNQAQQGASSHPDPATGLNEAESSAHGAARAASESPNTSPSTSPVDPARPRTPTSGQASAYASASATPIAPRSPVLPAQASSTASESRPTPTSSAAAPAPASLPNSAGAPTATASASQPRMSGSTPLTATATMSSVASSTSGFSSVEDPLAGDAGYEQLPDTDND